MLAASRAQFIALLSHYPHITEVSSSFVISANGVAMNLELFLNRQNIDRYVTLLSIISDQTQRRQIQNLLEEERAKTRELLEADNRQSEPCSL